MLVFLLAEMQYHYLEIIKL